MKKSDLWFRKLGFYNNPLSIKPAAFDNELLGYGDTIKEIETAINEGKFIFIEGDYGFGKTSILKKLIYTFGGRKKVIYFSCNRIENRLGVRKLLNERYGIIGKWFDLKPKDMVLLLDEAQSLTQLDYEKLHRYYTSGHFKSIVFVGARYSDFDFPEVIKKDVAVFKLAKLSPEDAVTIIRKRIGSLDLISDDLIKMIWERSGHNARRLLLFTETILKYVVEYNEDKVTEAIVERVLNTVLSRKIETLGLVKEKNSAKSLKRSVAKKVPEEPSAEVTFEEEPVVEVPEPATEKANDDFDEIDAQLAEMELDDEDHLLIEERKSKALKKKSLVSVEEALEKPTDELINEDRFY